MTQSDTTQKRKKPASENERRNTQKHSHHKTNDKLFEGERVAKVIARAGVASRRDAEKMIEEGRVKVNGRILKRVAFTVTDKDRIEVDDKPLKQKEGTRLWLYHKPKGLVVTDRDPEGRPTVFESLPPNLPRVMSVGRLDINTEGLLLLTNDGGLARVLEHPQTGWKRKYRVRAHGKIEDKDLEPIRSGITLDGIAYAPVGVVIERVKGDNIWLEMTLTEGKNREIKRLLEHVNLQVNRLIRTSFGPFELKGLEPGAVEEVRQKMVKDQLGKKLMEKARADFKTPINRIPVRDKPKDGETDQRTTYRSRRNTTVVMDKKAALKARMKKPFVTKP